MAPPTTTTARLTRGEAGRCARPLSLEPLKLEDGDHTGVEESPATLESRNPRRSNGTPPRRLLLLLGHQQSGGTPCRRRPPRLGRQQSGGTPHRRRPPRLGRQQSGGTPSPSTTLSARPPAGRRHHRGWHCTSKPSASSPVSTDDDHTAVETPKCSSATRPALHVQARHRPDAAITAKTPKCSPMTRPALHVQVRHRPAAAAVAGRRRADHPEELRGAGELTCNSAPEHALARMSVHALPDRCKCTRIARLAS